MRLKDLLSFMKKEEIPFSKDLIKENLIEANEILKKLNIRVWLTDGSLLGYYREGDIIGHDLDADLGCYIEDYSDEIIPTFIKKGWSVETVYGEKNCGLQISFSRNSVKVDIFFFYRESDGRSWHGAWQKYDKKSYNLIKYYYDPFEFKEIDFLGSKFMIPADTLHYVETKYGVDWKIPVKKWNWATDPANTVLTEIILKKNKKKKVY